MSFFNCIAAGVRLGNMISHKAPCPVSQPAFTAKHLKMVGFFYVLSTAVAYTAVCVCLSARLSVSHPLVCSHHHPGIHLQCHVGHYDNGCHSFPTGAPQPSHCPSGGRPARCAAPLPSPKGNSIFTWPGEAQFCADQCESVPSHKQVSVVFK